MKNIHSFTKNESGYTLILVFFILILVSVLSISLLSITTNSLSLSKHEREDQSIFYIAEAGVNVEKQNINRVVYEAYNYTREEHKNTPVEERVPDVFIDFFVDKIKSDLESSYPSTFNSFETQFGKEPEAKIEVDVIEDSDPLKINITSTGYFDDVVTNNRVVTQSINVDLNLKFLTNIDDDLEGENGSVPGLPQLAVQTTGDISLSGSSSIYGSAVTNSGSVKLDGNPTISGSIGVNENQLSGPNWLIDKFKPKVVNEKAPEIPLPAFPTDIFTSLSALPYPADLEVKKDEWNKKNIISNGSFLGDNYLTYGYTLNLNQDSKFKDFIINIGANNINLDIGNNTVNLLVDNFSLTGNLNIIGNGKLNIYVKDSLTLKTGSLNKNGDPNNVNIYYAGTTPIPAFGGDLVVASSLYAQSANLNFTAGLQLTGNIITGGTKVNISGGSSTGGQYIIAPNADISLSGGGHIKGVVIGKSFEGSGGTSVTYAPSVVPPPFKPNPTPDYSDPEDLISEEDLVEI